MMKVFVAVALTVSPALAQQPSAPSTGSAAQAAPLDPERLALGRTLADALVPPGTYERLMSGSMDKLYEGMLDQMLAMQVGDMLPEGSAADEEIERKGPNRSMREMMAAEDPHFEERMRITNRVMIGELVPIMTRLEPEVREALARAYARRYDAAQLTEISRFFATPPGRTFAADSLTLWMDPEIMAPMGKMVPELVKEMPAIIEKMTAATAHLPPPPDPDRKRKRR